MATPVETPSAPTGAPETTAPVPTAPAPTGDAPAPAPVPAEPTHGLPQQMADGVVVSGRGAGNGSILPETPAPSTDSPSQPTEPEAPKPEGDTEQVSDLPQWAQDLIKNTRGEVARTRVEAKKQAAEEAAAAAKKQMAEDIGRALGIITDDTPEEDKLDPDQLKQLLEGERTSTQMARTELAVFKAASGGTFNAAALLDSRSFLDSVKDLDPSDAEAVNAAIAKAIEANPWLKVEPAPSVDPAPADPAPAPVPTNAPTAPPSGGSFAGGPGGQPQDASTMTIDDFRKTFHPPRS